jgi:hypothetical protein
MLVEFVYRTWLGIESIFRFYLIEIKDEGKDMRFVLSKGK